jgi:hypothetical protein
VARVGKTLFGIRRDLVQPRRESEAWKLEQIATSKSRKVCMVMRKPETNSRRACYILHKRDAFQGNYKNSNVEKENCKLK